MTSAPCAVLVRMTTTPRKVDVRLTSSPYKVDVIIKSCITFNSFCQSTCRGEPPCRFKICRMFCMI